MKFFFIIKYVIPLFNKISKLIKKYRSTVWPPCIGNYESTEPNEAYDPRKTGNILPVF